jgi:diaminopropionate ammonia-lyase
MAFHLNAGARKQGADPYAPEAYADVEAFYARHPELEPTPLRSLPAFARALGVGELHVKDESRRFGLNAFKSLGVRYALDRLQRDGRVPGHATLACASAGNHGRAVARAARELHVAARVYMSSASSPAPRAAIAAEGADVVIVDGTYDDAVRVMAEDAAANGWIVVSDTSWPGYEEIPRLIMLGYTHMVAELRGQLPSQPDLVFAQGGVGGLVHGIAAGLRHYWPEATPRLVACEPSTAACLLESARTGRAAVIDAPLTTIMAGLRCAAPSPAAWPLIASSADAFVSIDDDKATGAMRMLAHPMGRDPSVEAGPSGACGFGALVAVMREESLRPVREALGLGPASRVVVINTEGATDPALYERILEGEPPAADAHSGLGRPTNGQSGAQRPGFSWYNSLRTR